MAQNNETETNKTTKTTTVPDYAPGRPITSGDRLHFGSTVKTIDQLKIGPNTTVLINTLGRGSHSMVLDRGNVNLDHRRIMRANLREVREEPDSLQALIAFLDDPSSPRSICSLQSTPDAQTIGWGRDSSLVTVSPDTFRPSLLRTYVRNALNAHNNRGKNVVPQNALTTVIDLIHILFAAIGLVGEGRSTRTQVSLFNVPTDEAHYDDWIDDLLLQIETDGVEGATPFDPTSFGTALINRASPNGSGAGVKTVQCGHILSAIHDMFTAVSQWLQSGNAMLGAANLLMGIVDAVTRQHRHLPSELVNHPTVRAFLDCSTVILWLRTGVAETESGNWISDHGQVSTASIDRSLKPITDWMKHPRASVRMMPLIPHINATIAVNRVKHDAEQPALTTIVRRSRANAFATGQRAVGTASRSRSSGWGDCIRVVGIKELASVAGTLCDEAMDMMDSQSWAKQLEAAAVQRPAGLSLINVDVPAWSFLHACYAAAHAVAFSDDGMVFAYKPLAGLNPTILQHAVDDVSLWSMTTGDVSFQTGDLKTGFMFSNFESDGKGKSGFAQPFRDTDFSLQTGSYFRQSDLKFLELSTSAGTTTDVTINFDVHQGNTTTGTSLTAPWLKAMSFTRTQAAITMLHDVEVGDAFRSGCLSALAAMMLWRAQGDVKADLKMKTVVLAALLGAHEHHVGVAQIFRATKTSILSSPLRGEDDSGTYVSALMALIYSVWEDIIMSRANPGWAKKFANLIGFPGEIVVQDMVEALVGADPRTLIVPRQQE